MSTPLREVLPKDPKTYKFRVEKEAFWQVFAWAYREPTNFLLRFAGVEGALEKSNLRTTAPVEVPQFRFVSALFEEVEVHLPDLRGVMCL